MGMAIDHLRFIFRTDFLQDDPAFSTFSYKAAGFSKFEIKGIP
jgi:hypothetical protein